MRFNTAEELIWIADGTRLPGYRVTGNFVRWDKYFQVRFGTKDGERRAYLCGHGHDDETDPPAHLRHRSRGGGQLVITALGNRRQGEIIRNLAKPPQAELPDVAEIARLKFPTSTGEISL